MSTLQRLTERGHARPPRWLPANVQYETAMGSVAYGVSSDTSDLDVYGWAIPPKDDVFPHLRGEVPGFGRPHRREYDRLVAALEAASAASRLPEAPTARPALNDLFVRIRTAQGGQRPACRGTNGDAGG